MFSLLLDEEANKCIEGVEYNPRANRGVLTVVARDEQHRQTVLKTVKKNIKKF